MEKLEFPRVGEQMYHEVLDNGLHVFVYPQAGISEELRLFCHQLRRHGHDASCWTASGTTPRPGWPTILEHKMFDTKDGNALQELAANGASPNAFTSSRHHGLLL